MSRRPEDFKPSDKSDGQSEGGAFNALDLLSEGRQLKGGDKQTADIAAMVRDPESLDARQKTFDAKFAAAKAADSPEALQAMLKDNNKDQGSMKAYIAQLQQQLTDKASMV